MTTDHRPRVSQLARLNQAVRQAIKLGRYDVAVEASDRALAILTNASRRFENSQIAIRTWTDRDTVLEVDDRLPDALRARMKALELARTLDRFPASELATILVQIAQNLRLLDRSNEATSYLAEARQSIDDVPIEASKQRGMVRARCLLLAGEADILSDNDETDQAEFLNAKALADWRRLYDTRLYPDGHPDLANAITDYGWIAGENNDDVAMAERYAEALAANERAVFGAGLSRRASLFLSQTPITTWGTRTRSFAYQSRKVRSMVASKSIGLPGVGVKILCATRRTHLACQS